MNELTLFKNLQNIYLSNSIYSWAMILFIALILTVLIKFIGRKTIQRMRIFAEKTSSIWDDVGLDVLEDIKPVFIFIHLTYLISRPLHQTESGRSILLGSVVVISIVQVWLAGQHLIKSWKRNILNARIQRDPSSAAALGLLYSTIQVLFVATIVLVGLSNLGVDIGALLAGLGVGGIAVALAAQNILGDLLASLSIVLDKPFVVGDYIVTGTQKGTIESIGIKTTRLRSISGEELILSNKDLLESRVHNFKRMQQRRVVHRFGVAYSTSLENLKAIPQWIQTFTERHPILKFDRCHLCQYGDSSLNFEWVFFVQDPEYNIFMDIQQQLLLDIFQKFAETNVQFAFPSRSIYVHESQGEAHALKTTPSPKLETPL